MDWLLIGRDFFLGDGNVQELIVVMTVVMHNEYTKNHEIVHFKIVNFM